MKMKKIAIAAALGAASTLAMAGGFDGPFVQLGIGGSSTSTKVTGADTGSVNGTKSSGSFNGIVAGGYSQSIGSAGFNMAANIFYVIGNQNSGNGGNSSDGVTTTQKQKNTFGISVEPGWNFTDSTLGYVKLAWVNSQTNTSFNSSDSNGSAKSNVNGFGYGLGVKQLLTKNIFVGVDLMGVSYGSASNAFDSNSGVSAKPSQFLGFASVGYKF